MNSFQENMRLFNEMLDDMPTMNVGQFQTKLNKHLDQTILKEIKKALGRAKDLHSFSKTFKLKFDKKTLDENEKLNNTNLKINKTFKIKDKKFTLDGETFTKTKTISLSDEIISFGEQNFGKNYADETVTNYMYSLKNNNVLKDWVIKDYRITTYDTINSGKKNKKEIELKMDFEKIEE